MEQIINFFKQTWVKISLLILIIIGTIVFTIVTLLPNNKNSLSTKILQSCKTMCVYNFNKSTWDFFEQDASQNSTHSFPTENDCLGFCIMTDSIKQAIPSILKEQ